MRTPTISLGESEFHIYDFICENGSALPQATASHAELRPARFVVDPSHSGESRSVLRLRLSGLGDKCEQVAARGCTIVDAASRRVVRSGGRLSFRRGETPRPHVCRPLRKTVTDSKMSPGAKTKSQEEMNSSSYARGDDILNQSQLCVRVCACGKKVHNVLRGFWGRHAIDSA